MVSQSNNYLYNNCIAKIIILFCLYFNIVEAKSEFVFVPYGPNLCNRKIFNTRFYLANDSQGISRLPTFIINEMVLNYRDIKEIEEEKFLFDAIYKPVNLNNLLHLSSQNLYIKFKKNDNYIIILPVTLQRSSIIYINGIKIQNIMEVSILPINKLNDFKSIDFEQADNFVRFKVFNQVKVKQMFFLIVKIRSEEFNQLSDNLFVKISTTNLTDIKYLKLDTNITLLELENAYGFGKELIVHCPPNLILQARSKNKVSNNK